MATINSIPIVVPQNCPSETVMDWFEQIESYKFHWKGQMCIQCQAINIILNVPNQTIYSVRGTYDMSSLDKLRNKSMELNRMGEKCTARKCIPCDAYTLLSSCSINLNIQMKCGACIDSAYREKLAAIIDFTFRAKKKLLRCPQCNVPFGFS